MALTLEITRPDGAVITKTLDAANLRIDAQAGETFRVLDMHGQPVAGLTAIREGDDLVVDGLPEKAELELCDFFKPGEDDQVCVLTLPDAQAVVAPGAEPVMLAQNTAADTKTDAAMDKAAETKDAGEAKAAAAAKPAASETAAAGTTVEEAAANPSLSGGTIALGAVALLGVAAAASGGSSDSSPPPATPPAGPAPMPAPTATLEGGDLSISGAEAANGFSITGMTAPGSTVVVTLGSGANAVTTTTTADADGNYTATLDGAALPADGSYPLSVTATSPGPDSQTATNELGEVTITANADGAQSVVDAGAATLTGFAGNDVLVGGNDIGVANGNFQTWDLNDYHNSVPDSAGDVYDPAPAPGDNSSIQIDIITDSPTRTEQPGLGGWTATFNNTAGGATPLTVGNVGFNGVAEAGSNPVTSSDFGRLEFITNAANPGSYLWETVTSETSGGGGLTQTLSTVAGQTYSLSFDAIVANDTGSDSDSHASAGTSIEIRWGGETVAFFDATANGEAGAWLTTGDLVTPTAADGRWTFAGLDASADSTDLAIIAYEQYSAGGDPTTAFNDGVGLRIGNIEVSGTAGAASQTITGGAGSDQIFGQGGDDIIYGGTANTPDTDRDVFVYSMTADNGADMIMDFTEGTDVIQLVNVSDANTTGSLVPGDTREDTGTGTEGALGSATDEALTSEAHLTVDDLLVANTQSITVSEADGNTKLEFTGAGGEDLGSVTLVGVTGQYVDGDNAASVGNLISNNILSFSAEAFQAQFNVT